MRIYKYTFVCMLSLLLAACMGGIDAIDSGPQNSQLTAQAWFLNNQYKSVLNWDAIAGAQSYDVVWVGDIAYADMAGIDANAMPFELLEHVNTLGYTISSGELTSTTEDLDHDALDAGVGYCYVATGMSGSSALGHTNVDCISTLAIPPVITAAGSGQVTVSWEPVEGAAKYYVWRSEYVASPSVSRQADLDLSKQVPPYTVCAGLPLEVLVDETTDTSLLDDNNGEGLSNCPIYCYTVVPESIEGNIMQGETQWDIALPEPEGTLENIWVFNSLSGPFYGVAVTENDEIIVSHDSGLVIKYSWDGSKIWETDLTQTHDLVGTSALELYGGSVYVAVTLGTNIFNSKPGVCALSINNGALANFGEGGCAGASISSSASVTDIAVQSDGMILISANENGVAELITYAYACRFLASGDVDLSFGSTGGKLGKGWSGCYARMSLATHAETADGITVYSDGGEERSAVVGRRFTGAGYKGLVILLDNDGQELEVDDSSINGQLKGVTVAADSSLLSTGAIGSNGIVVNYGVSPLSLIDSAVYSDSAKGSVIGGDCRDKPVIGGSFDGDIAGAWRIGDLDDLTSLLLDDGFGTGGILVLHDHLGATDETYGFAYSPNSGNYVFVGVLDALERWKPFIAIVH